MWINIHEKKPRHNQCVLAISDKKDVHQVCHYDKNKNKFVYWSDVTRKEKIKKNVTEWYDGLPTVSYNPVPIYISLTRED